jgi:hypothetical protein
VLELTPEITPDDEREALTEYISELNKYAEAGWNLKGESAGYLKVSLNAAERKAAALGLTTRREQSDRELSGQISVNMSDHDARTIVRLVHALIERGVLPEDIAGKPEGDGDG